MFGFFKKKRKKTPLEIQIEKDGIEHAARRISEIVLSKIPTNKIAYQFLLEELDAASQGEGIALDFVNRSGIDPSLYKGAMKNSMIEVDGPNGPQQTLSAFCFHLHENRMLMAELRIMVVENIMRHFSFGKYNEGENAITQYNLGVSYLTGQGGVNQDMAEAAKWFKLAAEKGNVSAYFNLGLMYKNGQGVSQDKEKAAKWFKLAAEKGHARALLQIEFIDQNIEEIEKDKAQSKDLVQSLSRQGDVNAQFNNGIASYNIQNKNNNSENLNKGMMYLHGISVQKDLNEAAKWFKLAAEEGDTTAQFNLGLMYMNGNGVKKDEKEAMKWLMLSMHQR
ncbi:Sel1-like repeat [Bartonella choladocola]|uniref:tetratricopeptide repeat protein n=1 Tax=Bartonella choladocola TaxID=2750995 RepID=UPI0039993169